ncbi:MAG: DUF885 domain-containing protein [Oceanicaulis sp.]
MALRDLADRYWAFERREYPLNAMIAGQPTEDEVVFRESEEDYARKGLAAAEFLAELESIDPARLSGQEAATHALMRHELTLIRNLYQTGAHLRPSLFPVGPDFNTVFLANSTALNSRAEAELWLARLETLPAFVDDLIANFEAGRARGYRYPRVVLERAIAVVDGYLDAPPEGSAWYGPFKRSSVAARIESIARLALKHIADTLLPAFAGYRAYLADVLLAEARETLSICDEPDGDAFYAVLAARFTTTSMSPAAIHDLGLSEVDRLRGEMEALAKTHGFSDAASLKAHVMETATGDLADGEAVRRNVEVLAKRIDAKIPAYFGRIPRITYGIESMSPAQSERMPPAYAQPAPAGGGQAGLFWVSAMPEKCPRYMHVPLTLHEAWPGHLMHIALIQEMDHLPEFRRFGAVKYTPCIEGWALYCETLGKDMGFYGAVEDDFGRLDMEMWRAVRLVADTGLHLKRWSRKETVSYMLDHLSLSRETIEAEVDRYIALPGQALGYQIGGLKVRHLRARVEAELGEDFSLRDFHDAVTGAGAVTLPVLEELVTASLRSRVRAA